MQEKSKTFKIILISLMILVVIIGVALGIRFYNASNNPTATPNDQKSIPFQTRGMTPNDSDLVITPSTPEPITNNPATTTTTQVGRTRLTKLWNAPVSGFDFVYKDIEIYATTSTTTLVRATTTPATTTLATTSSSTRIFSVDEKKTTTTITATKVITPVLRKIVLKNQEFIYIWDRATGNIFDNLASTSDVVRISNMTIPKIEEAYFNSATSVFIRGLDTDNETVVSRNLTLLKDTATSTMYSINERYVYLYAKQVAMLQDSNKMFYFTEKTGKGSISSTDGTSITTTISTPLTEWLSQFVNNATVAITTRPSAYFPGYLFFVNTNGGGGNQYILGEKYGLTTLTSPDGRKVLYSEVRNSQLETVIYDVKTKKEITLSQATLSEKCVWTADSATIYCAVPQILATLPYPDAWYQGKTSFADNIWSVNPVSGEFSVVIGLKNQIADPMDVQNLKISKNKKYLLFQDRYSLALWKYDL